MKAKILLAIFVLLFLFFATPAFAHEETRELTLSAEGITLLDVDCGSGFLEITGKEGLTRIEVQAEIIVKGMSTKRAKNFIKDKLKLTLEKNGQRAQLVSKFKSHSSLVSWGTKAINLTVFVPRSMELKVDDGSGGTTISNIVGNVNLKDGSGSIDLIDIHGDLDVDDGSGGLVIENITGNIKIDDGSGNINIENATGNVFVDDGSGTIRMEGIGGEVIVDDSSGDIRIRNAMGDVVISDGSGDIRIDGVEKDVHIKRAGSGGVVITNVKGQIIR